MRHAHEFPEFFFCPELRINLHIIHRIILVIRYRPEDWCQIDRRNSKVLQIVQFFDNSTEISARKTFRCRQRSPLHIDIGAVLFCISTEKTVHKNLIEHRALHPFYRRQYVIAVDVRHLEEIVKSLREIIL